MKARSAHEPPWPATCPFRAMQRWQSSGFIGRYENTHIERICARGVVVDGEEEFSFALAPSHAHPAQIRGKAMASKSGDMLEVARDVLLTARLDDRARFVQMVNETKASMESGESVRGGGEVEGRGRREGGREERIVEEETHTHTNTPQHAPQPLPPSRPGILSQLQVSEPRRIFGWARGCNLPSFLPPSLRPGIIGAGHSYAARRLGAQSSVAGWMGEQTGGLSYLEYIRALAKRLEGGDWEGVQADLEAIRSALLNR
jgi:hypothetical protein